MIDDMCKPVLEAELYLGRGDINKGKQRIAELRDPGDRNSQMMYNLTKHCDNDDSKLALMAETSKNITHTIYSMGTYSFNGQSCKGYLTEAKGTTSQGETIGYNLNGMGSCSNQLLDKDVFHPVNKPSGINAGDYYKNTLAYDGEMPINWKFQGQVYPFTTEVQQAIPITSVPSHEDSTDTVAGKFVIKSYNDEAIHQQVFLNNKIIEKCGGVPCADLYSMSVHNTFEIDGKTVLLIEYGTGGNACGVYYGFFTIDKDGSYESTDKSIGDCSEIAEGSLVQSGSRLTLTLPSQDQTDSPEIWTYENGQITGPYRR